MCVYGADLNIYMCLWIKTQKGVQTRGAVVGTKAGDTNTKHSGESLFTSRNLPCQGLESQVSINDEITCLLKES